MTLVNSGQLPLNRALTPTPHQQLIREWVLCMKEGEVSPSWFHQKFGVDPLVEFAGPWPISRRQAT